MTKPFREWTVLPHGQLTQLDENMLSVTGKLNMPPMGEVDRRMTVVRLADRRLVIYSAISLAEAEMQALEAFGTPAYLIVPNAIHRLDARTWKDRYPSLTIVTPAAGREKVEKVVPVDATSIDFGDPAVRFMVVPGTGEAALLVETSAGTTLVLNDLIFNLPNRPGLSGFVFKAIGMTGDEPHMPPVIKMRQVKDQGALRAQLEQWSRLPNLKRVIISHGPIIEDQPAATLDRIARDLAA